MKVKPKKSLGQNFLVNDSLAKKIVDFGNISKDDIVLEIGPGAGKLTEKIINKKPKKIIVIEKDVNLVSILSKKFNKKIDVINEDIVHSIADLSLDDLIGDPRDEFKKNYPDLRDIRTEYFKRYWEKERRGY